MIISKLILKYSTGASPPDLRTVSRPESMWVPFAHFLIRSLDARSTYLVKLMSCTFTLPPPPPVAMCVVPLLDIPQDQPRISILSTWTESCDSPLMLLESSRKISTAISLLLVSVWQFQQMKERAILHRSVWKPGSCRCPSLPFGSEA